MAAVVRSRADLQRVYEEIATTVAQALGFLAVVVNVYRPAWDDYEVVVVEGDDAAAREALLGEHVDPVELARLLDERFRRHGTFLVPYDQFDFRSTGMTWVSGTDGGDAPDAWHADDALLVPLTSSDGRPLAFLSLDDPIDGRRPNDGALEIVSAVAAIAASVIEHAQLSAEAARHRAAVEHLLRVSSELTTSTSRTEMLRAVCEGIRDGLGFEKAGVFLDVARDGRLLPVAGVGFEGVEDLGSFTTAAIEPMMAPELQREGCVLMDSATARAMASELGVPTVYASHSNGRGPHAWDHHWLMVPLRDRTGALVGFLWADDPTDRLLPGVDGLRALRAFANHAVAALEAANHLERMRELAELDPLTGLRNRRGFEQGLEDGRAPLALVICDLDHFKRVNDTLGHPVGDEVLRRFADLLRGCTREDDVAVRLGGEEFALVLSGVGEREALAVAERLRREVAATFRDFPVPISVSVGIADGARDVGAEALVRAANRALYAAKRLGRDRCVVHHAETLAMLDALADERAGEQLAAAMLLAETLDLRDVATARHSETVGRYAEQIAAELGLVTGSRGARARRRRAARHRQARHLRRRAAQAGPAREPRVAGGPAPPRDRRPDPRARQPARRRRLGALAPRADRRHGLPARARRPGDPARGPHPRGGRRLRGDDGGPAVPQRVDRGRGARRAAPRRGNAVRPARGRGVRARARRLKLAVIPARGLADRELHRDPLRRLSLDVGARLLVEVGAAVPLRDLRADPRDQREVAMDAALALEHHAAQLVVRVAGLELQRAARVTLEVAHLLRLRVRPRPALALAHHEPQRHQVRPGVAPHRGAGDDALIGDERGGLVGRHRDLAAAAHELGASSRSAAASTASRASAGSSTAASPASLRISFTR